MAIGGGYNLAENTKVKIQYRTVTVDNYCDMSLSADEKKSSGIKTEIVTAF